MGKNKIAFGAIFCLATVLTGVSFLTQPKTELLYDATNLPPVCVDKSCIRAYVNRIGNTGSKEIASSYAVLRWNEGDVIALQPSVHNEGKIPRKFERQDGELTTRLTLGSLEPGEWLEVRIALQFPNRESVLDAEDLFTEIGFEDGKGKPGSPTGTRFFRALWRMIDLFA